VTREDLPDAELDVLAALWHRGESTARELKETLAPARPMSHAAVFTLLCRLEEKDLVGRTDRKVGKAFVYRARCRPAATYRRKVKDLVERLFGGSRITLVHSLFETAPPDDAEIERLEALLADMKSRRGNR